MKNANLDKIVVFPMFPQYASASTGSALQKVMELVAAWPTIPEINFISAYHDNDAMLDVYVRNAQKYTLTDYDHFLFSFHGIPQRQLIKSDCGTHCLASENCCQKLTDANKMCYSAQCYDAAFALAAKMKLDKKDFSVAFQSRLGREKWTEPFTPDVLEQLIEKGIKRLLVFSPSFTADCLETTIEIGTEYQEDFIKMGGEKLDLVESLNDNPLWIDAIHEIIRPYLYAD
jgi:ferrochelatase